jgi:hypothetical protein
MNRIRTCLDIADHVRVVGGGFVVSTPLLPKPWVFSR